MPARSDPSDTRLLLKRGLHQDPDTVVEDRTDDDAESSGVRCPLCSWRPEPGSLWCCTGHDPAEPGFQGCGTVWDTFATRGLCPGCQHRWRWTKCFECDAWSPHDDWYEGSVD